MRSTTVARLLVTGALTVCLAPGCRADRPDPATSLRRAVDRTIDAGSMRFRGRVVPASGEAVTISGVASLTTDDAVTGSWRPFLDRVRAASDVTRAGDRRLRGRLTEGTVTVSLGPAGHIEAISFGLAGGSIELDLYDFGVHVQDAPPP